MGKNTGGSVEWALSLARLIDATNNDQTRVIRPVSPRITIRVVEVVVPRGGAKKKRKPPRRR